jgi:hypothetical protein
MKIVINKVYSYDNNIIKSKIMTLTLLLRRILSECFFLLVNSKREYINDNFKEYF